MLCHKVSCTAVGKHLTDQAQGSNLLHTKVGDDVSDRYTVNKLNVYVLFAKHLSCVSIFLSFVYLCVTAEYFPEKGLTLYLSLRLKPRRPSCV